MLRLSKIIRNRQLTTALRAGRPPTWDRPDPPTERFNPRTTKYKHEEFHVSFHDTSSPTYFVIAPENTWGNGMEQLPNFAQIWGSVFFATACVSVLFMFFISNRKYIVGKDFMQDVLIYQRSKAQLQNKPGIKDMMENPWKINAHPQCFPCEGSRQFRIPQSYYSLQDSIKSRRKINQEGLVYLNTLKDLVEKEMKDGKSHH